MAEHLHPHPPRERPPETPLDSGSQALTEALRSSFGIIKVVMIGLVLVFLGSGFFAVGPQENAIILRLGRPVGEGQKALLGPGLHWSFPYPIYESIKVSITGPQKVVSSVGWYATTPAMEAAGSEPPPGPSLNPAIDGYVLTGDGNIIHARATLTYIISDPVRYIFSFANSSNAVQNVVDNALLHAASRFAVDAILVRDVVGFTEAVRQRTAELARSQDLGIAIEQCVVRSIPPRQLKQAFDDVLKAEVNRNKALIEARSHENQVLSRASADAQSRTNTAESDRALLVAEISRNADQFRELLPKYRQNPNLFVQQRLTGTLGQVFTNAQEKIFVSRAADGRSRELRLLLNREPLKPKAEANRP